MKTYAQLRRLAADCRADKEKAPLEPDSLDALLDIAELSAGSDEASAHRHQSETPAPR